MRALCIGLYLEYLQLVTRDQPSSAIATIHHHHRYSPRQIDISETFVLHLYVDAGRDLERIGVQIVVELMFQEADPKK